MEVEAKFAARDQAVLDRLATAESLGAFALGPVEIQAVEDTYLDTPDRGLLASGHTCRRRETGGGGVRITVKSLEMGDASVFRREELEVDLDEPSLQPDEWPEGPVRSRVMGLVGEEPLMPLVHLTQTRRVRPVSSPEGEFAELYLDDVQVSGREGTARFFEVELESRPAAREEEFLHVTALLSTEAGLSPLDRPKFLRALAIVEGEEALLLPHEEAVSRRIAELEDAYGRRARALLALHEGATQAEAGARAGFSSRWARHWLAEFRRERMGIFPGEVFVGIGFSESGLDVPAPSCPEELDAVPDALPGSAGTAPDLLPEGGPDLLAEAGSGELLEPADATAAPAPRRSKKSQTGIVSSDTMAEAADKILAFHLERMVEHEEGTRLGDDIEELHDMRVATRRMRAALRLLDPFLDEDSMRPFLKGLRRTGRALGVVRDLDVFREKAERYVAALPAGHEHDLAPLFAAWHDEYARCRKQMTAYLDGRRYQSFRDDFSGFLEEPQAGSLPVVFDTGEVRPYRVRDVLPYLIYEHAAEVWGYDEHIVGGGTGVPLVRYHHLRMAAKALRYALEFFQEVLGPEAKELISAVKRLQDHLGDLQDAVVTCNVLRDYLTWGTWGAPGGPKARVPASVIVAPGVAGFLAFRQTELQSLVDTFPTVWNEVVGPVFRRRLAEMVGKL